MSRDLIARVRSGDGDPDHNAQDKSRRDAMATRGYYQAFQVVRQSVSRVLEGENPGAVFEEDHGAWYRALFSPSVTAGIVSDASEE